MFYVLQLQWMHKIVERSSGPAHANCTELKNVTLDVQFVTDVILLKEDTYSLPL